MLFSLLCLIILIPHSFAGDNFAVDENNSTLTANDYYFDVNEDSDGNGSEISPYNNFTNDRIKDDSIIHLAGGKYCFNQSRTFSNITFYGKSPYETILDGKGSTLTVSDIVNFKNITLTNFNLINNANLNASNTFFRELIPAHSAGDNLNDFGGAISAFENKNTYLDNCSFFNNCAQYGGAIYACGGNLTILNSIFYNNTAYNFGGAIIGDLRAKIIIKNTRFIYDNSVDDAGGALYLISSSLTASNMTIANCSSTFGSAITALKSDLNLTNVTFKDNRAEYEGGAVYQYYGSLSITSSKFIANTARNGGALFIDDVDVKKLDSNEFIDNIALNYGGAIYSLLKKIHNYTDNIFENNSAYLFNDVYNTTDVNLTLGNGNYTMYAVNLTSNITVPVKYDLRQYGFVTSVKDQQKGGNCWAFSAIATLESCILKASGEIVDFSEENVKNLMAWYSDYGRNAYNPNDGGLDDMAIAYLVSWLGPVGEGDDEYDDKSQLSPVLNSLMHVQNILFLKRDTYTDNNAIKQAIMNYGAVSTTMYYDDSYRYYRGGVYIHYYTGDKGANHAVTIVGWDDNVYVNGKYGAWLVKNSWGPDWANSGYFYVSYYDTGFAKPGNYASYTFILNDTKHYDKNYQYDVSGVTDYFYVNHNSVWYENAFNASDDEFLAAVSTYFNQNTNWELFIYVNSKLQLTQNGSSIPGYYTINLNYPVPLKKGDLFEILFKITTEGDAGFPISEGVSITKETYRQNVSFVSLNGNSFYDLYDLYHEYPGHWYSSQVACIKGFTQLIRLNSTFEPLNITYDALDLFNITLSLLDENSNAVLNGEVIFNVNGENHTVDVYNGIAFIQIPFVLGINNVSWYFNSPNYNSCAGNTTFELPPIFINMNITVLEDFNNAYINFTFSQSLDENLTVNINGINQTFEIINGTVYLNLTSLEYGEYNISAFIDNEIYNCRNSTSFFINVKRTHIESFDLVTVYNDIIYYSARLLDEFSMPAVGCEVKFMAQNTYSNITDINGVAVIAVNLKEGVYQVIVDFEGNDLYFGSQNSSNITVKSSIMLPQTTDYTLNSNYQVKLLSKTGDPLNDTYVTFTIDNKNYSILTDSNGVAIFAIPVSSGNFAISVLNPDTKEESSQSITVLKRLTQNQDMSFYFGNTPIYKVRICDDNGLYVAGLKVKVTLNNNVYYLLTDSDGWVSLKLNLKQGKYTIAFEYKGYKVSNKITVRPILITKDMKVKKGKTVKFTAKLLNKNGKALKGKKIKFKIKSKRYTAKTNKNGIAKINIKNLKAGKYKITTKYGSLSVKNTITIKK